MANWCYAKDGQQYGPIASAQLKLLARSGELQPDDLVCKEGSTGDAFPLASFAEYSNP
jgi:hypothetical protein